MNLKVNLDGRGFKDVEKDNDHYVDFIKAKRNEFIRLNMTTVGVIMTATFLIAGFRGHLKQNVTWSIILWNAAGIALNIFLSLGAK